MAEKTSTLEQLKDVAKHRIRKTVKTLYFPEIWYSVENYFQDTKVKSVVDVGCGNGLIADALAKSGFEITCVDPVLKCLKLAQKRLAASGNNGRFEQSDPETLPFADNSFENLVSINMLEFCPHPDVAMAEMHRVLRPGGRAVIASFNRRSPWGVATVARHVRRDFETKTTRLLTKEEFARLIKKTGFKIEQVGSKAKYLPTATRVSRFKLPMTGCYVVLCTKLDHSGTLKPTKTRPL